MNFKYKIQKSSMSFIVDRLLKYIDKNPHANIVKMSRVIEPVFSKIFPPENFKKFRLSQKIKIMSGHNLH